MREGGREGEREREREREREAERQRKEVNKTDILNPPNNNLPEKQRNRVINSGRMTISFCL